MALHGTKRWGAAATGLLIAMDAAAARLLFSADAARVYFLGRPIQWVCSFRSRLGLPCPGCGLTRSIVLALHGDVESAWRLAPAGPVALFGMLAFAAALLVFALWPARVTTKRWIQRGALAYGALTTLLWIVSWTTGLAAGLGAR